LANHYKNNPLVFFDFPLITEGQFPIASDEIAKPFGDFPLITEGQFPIASDEIAQKSFLKFFIFRI